MNRCDFGMMLSNMRRKIEYQYGRTGRGAGIRTPGLLLPKQARYQAALRPD